MSAVEKGKAQLEYEKIRKCWTTQQQKQRMMRDADSSAKEWTGVTLATLHTMAEVEVGPHLAVGQMFPTRDIIMICAAKEANLRGIHVTVMQSDKSVFQLYGKNFIVHATNSEASG